MSTPSPVKQTPSPEDAWDSTDTEEEPPGRFVPPPPYFLSWVPPHRRGVLRPPPGLVPVRIPAAPAMEFDPGTFEAVRGQVETYAARLAPVAAVVPEPVDEAAEMVAGMGRAMALLAKSTRREVFPEILRDFIQSRLVSIVPHLGEVRSLDLTWVPLNNDFALQSGNLLRTLLGRSPRLGRLIVQPLTGRPESYAFFASMVGAMRPRLVYVVRSPHLVSVERAPFETNQRARFEALLRRPVTVLFRYDPA